MHDGGAETHLALQSGARPVHGGCRAAAHAPRCRPCHERADPPDVPGGKRPIPRYSVRPQVRRRQGSMSGVDRIWGQPWLCLHPTQPFGLVPGSEQQIDTDAYPLSVTRNGPEFGWDSAGWSVYYTKAYDSVPSLWRALALVDGGSVAVYEEGVDMVRRIGRGIHPVQYRD